MSGGQYHLSVRRDRYFRLSQSRLFLTQFRQLYRNNAAIGLQREKL